MNVVSIDLWGKILITNEDWRDSPSTIIYNDTLQTF